MTKSQDLIERLGRSKIRYCHWKSNILLSKALVGETDIDLLIDRKDTINFRKILDQLDFKPAVTTDGDPFPSIEHYYALDEIRGILLHVHAYYRVITGESLTKNYRFPIEELLLENVRQVDSILVPAKSAELIVFTLRMMLKHTSLVEILLLNRYWKDVREEINWLLETDTLNDANLLVRDWLPSLDPQLFSECVRALKTPAPLLRRVMLGHKLRSQIRIYSRHSTVDAWLNGIQKFLMMFYRRFFRSQKNIALRNGGAIIAFVGPEATGKSTLISEMRGWLGEHFAVDQIHIGKPNSTLISFFPNLFLPALRSLFPGARSTHVSSQFNEQADPQQAGKKYSLLFYIRSVLLAHDRWALISRAYSQAANGTIILCDRYPSMQSGAPDSPQLSHISLPTRISSIRRRFANIEAQLYREIPSPDLVIYLSAPIEVTLSRNTERMKTEPEDYVRWRHARSSNLDFGKIPVCEINTDQPFNQTVLDIKKSIWEAL